MTFGGSKQDAFTDGSEAAAATEQLRQFPRSDPLVDGLVMPRLAWAMVTIWVTASLAVMDGAIVNIALPTIAAQLGISPSSSIWLVNAYQLAAAMMLLPLASLGEAIGYKRVYQSGVVVFVAASIGCAFAKGLPALAALRFFQGLGAAAIMAVNAALVRLSYPRARLARGLGHNAAVVAAASALAPSLAAGILALASWRWLFLINVPFGLIALIAGWRSLPDTPGTGRPYDWGSAALMLIAFAALFSSHLRSPTILFHR